MIDIREYDGKYVVLETPSNTTFSGKVLMPKGSSTNDPIGHFTIADAEANINSWIEYCAESYISHMKAFSKKGKRYEFWNDYDISVENVVAIRDITEDLIQAGV